MKEAAQRKVATDGVHGVAQAPPYRPDGRSRSGDAQCAGTGTAALPPWVVGAWGRRGRSKDMGTWNLLLCVETVVCVWTSELSAVCGHLSCSGC